MTHTWALRVKPPVLRRKTGRRELPTVVGLSLRGRFILIWDRAPAHRATVVTNYLRKHPEIYEERLPSYAPELNPEEYCYGDVKEQTRNGTPQSVAEIGTMVDRSFARLRQRPDLLDFFRNAGLTVKRVW